MSSNSQPPSEQLPALPYGATRGRADRYHVATVLHPDAAIAVRQVMAEHCLTASGAVHHLVRIAAGLPSLLP